MYFSSAYIYDRSVTNILTETSALQNDKQQYYLEQKIKSEIKIQQKLDKYLIFRVSSPISSELKNNVVFKIFLENALKNLPIILDGSGKREQNFIYTKEIAIQCEKAILAKNIGIYNLVYSEAISMTQLAERIIKLTNSKSKIVYKNKTAKENLVNNNFSNKKLLLSLGKKLEFTIEEALTEIIKNYENRSII